MQDASEAPQVIPLRETRHERPRRAALGAFLGLSGGLLLLALITSIFGAKLLLPAFVGVVFGAIFLSSKLGSTQAGAGEAVLEGDRVQLPHLMRSLKSGDVRSGVESALGRVVILDLVNGETLRLFWDGEDDSAGDRILTALGVGAAQRRATLPLRRTLGRFTIGFVTFFASMFCLLFASGLTKHIGFHTPSVALLSLGLMVLTTAAVVLRFGAPYLIIGSDGLKIRGLLRQPFLPYADIASLHAHDTTTLSIVLRNGAAYELPLVTIGRDRVQAIIERVERLRREANASSTRTRIEHVLRRGDRSIAEWREALTRSAQGVTTFRDAPIDSADLARVLIDPEATPDQRIGAAFMLKTQEGARVRIATAAEASADDKLREALLAAAEGELDSPTVERLTRRG